MADLNIRNVPEGLMRGVKRAALDGGVTLREWCLKSLSDALGARDEQIEKAAKSQAPEAGDDEVEKPRKAGRGERGKGSRSPATAGSEDPGEVTLHGKGSGQEEYVPLDMPSDAIAGLREANILVLGSSLSPETQERAVGAEDVIADEDIPDPEPELEMCKHREFDDQVGEWFGCRLRQHSAKIKHQKGDKVVE